MKTIREVCNISYRTALRYIRSISQANIPVYYDRDLKGYRLLTTDSNWVHDPTLNDLILILYALSLIKPSLNSHYQSEIDLLVRKIISEQGYKLEELLTSFDFDGESINDLFSPSQKINKVLLRLAFSLGRDITLVTKTDGKDKEVTINNPRLWFKKHWQITGDNFGYDKISLLNNISHIKLQ